MDGPRIIGHLIHHPDGGLTGWCWSPDLPSERLDCEILADDAVFATVRADEWVDGLRAQGIGDGRHGFGARLPAPLGARARLLTARHAATGAIFDRVRLLGEPPPDPRAVDLARSIGQVRARLDAARPAAPPGRALRSGMAALAATLSQSADGSAAMRHAIGPVLGEMTVPVVAQADVSVVLLAHDATTAARTLRALAPALTGALAASRVELLVASAAAHLPPATLCARLPGAAALDGPPAMTVAGLLDRALAAARADRIVVLDDTHAAPSAAALADILDAGCVIVGHAPVALAARLVLAAALRAEPRPSYGPLPLLIAGPVETLCRAGGLDPAFDESPPAGLLDLCLRLMMLGEPVAWTAPAPGPVEPETPATARAPLDLLAARWGRVGAPALD